MGRTYEQTHPWLTFSLDTTRLNRKLCMALGEASSKCEHIAGVPLAPAVADQIHLLYLVKGALATTAIEGNTLSENEAARMQQYLADELNNIVDATNTLTTRLVNGEHNGIITVALLKEMNQMVLRGLKLPEDVVPGERRKHGVVVGRYRCPPAEDCDYLLERFCEVLNEFPCPDADRNAFCIVKAIFAHLYFVWIHPFGDGNGRTARLLELFILLSAGFPQPIGHLLSDHYNKTRSRYYERLDAAVQGMDQVIEFIQYSVAGLVDGLHEQIAFIRGHQSQAAWMNYVHERFHHQNRATDTRRKHLVLALSAAPAAVPTSKVAELSPQLVREYYDKTHKTLARDINALIDMGLVVREPGGRIRAKREEILAFLPWRVSLPVHVGRTIELAG